MAANLRELALPGGDAREVLAIVGAGHLSGLARHLREDDVAPAIVRADLEALEEKSAFPWLTLLLAVFVLGRFAWGFWQGGIDVAAEQMLYWVLLKIGRAHGCTQVTNAQLLCRLLLEEKNILHQIY